jgi:uncharacterized membrane protein
LRHIVHAPTILAFAIPIGGGVLALLSGIIAVCARKDGRLHRKAGAVFVASMAAMAIFACYLAVAMPEQRVNVFVGAFALYLVSTAWLAVRRKSGATGFAEKLALAVAVCLCAPFAILSFQLAAGMTPLFKSAVPFRGRY